MGTAILLELVRTFSSMVSNGKVRAFAGQPRLWPESGWGREAVRSSESGHLDLAPNLATHLLAAWA